MDSHLPVLIVVVPLIGALLAALLRRGTAAWAVTVLVCVALPAIAGRLLYLVLSGGPISYHLGGWEPAVGIEYRVDILNAGILLLIAAMAAVIMPLARQSVMAEIAPDRVAWFYAVFLLCVAGLMGMAVTGDAFNVFVFMEISSLASYTLIGLGRDRRALLAAFQYLIVGTIGATFYVIGVGLLYIQTGTLNLTLIAERIGPIEETPAALAALAFIFVGVSLKLALFPLHVWLPNAYAYAPSLATTFLAATATKVAIYLLIRYVFWVFGGAFILGQLPVGVILIALSLAAMFGAATVAVFQSDIKRMLAYSSVSQIGYITLGIGFGSVTGLTGGIAHIFNHAMMKAAAFAAVAGVMLRAGSVRLEDVAGIGRAMPATMLAFVVAGLGLIGVPGTAGFISKWYLVMAALEEGWWWMAFLIVASSLIAILYVGRVVEAAFFRAPSEAVAGLREAPPGMLLTMWLLAGMTIFFGLDPDLTAGTAARSAEMLLGARP